MLRVVVSLLLVPALIIISPSIAVAPELLAKVETKAELATQISRGAPAARIERRVMTVTAYTAGKESTGKTLSDPDYGQTAISTLDNPVFAKEWYTIAAPPNIQIGTHIYIPFFADKPNKGIFVVEDRGGSIKGNRLDVYFGDPEKDNTAVKRAIEFGVQELEIWITH